MTKSIYGMIISEWKSDAKVRAEFGNVALYATFREHQHAKATGTTVQALRNAVADQAGYIAKLEASGQLQPGDRDRIAKLATEWEASDGIRAQFGAFNVYCSFMRADAAGKIKHFGNRR